jgi:mono/diheme cytochrome c family protein
MRKLVFLLSLVSFCLFLNKPHLLAKECSRGEIFYRGFCEVCHGAGGLGDGISAPAMMPVPPDFTSNEFEGLFEKERVFAAVLNGKAGTQMEGFKDRLTREDVGDVLDYLFPFQKRMLEK